MTTEFPLRRRFTPLRNRPDDARAVGHMSNSWVLPTIKVAFVDLAKNASTSIKWLLAEASGQDLDGFPRLNGYSPTPFQTIHRRGPWRGLQHFHELDASAREGVAPGDGWFVFAVVRDPRLRSFSAWQSKFLIGNPLHTTVFFPDAPWLPRVPAGSDDVVADFSRFVEALGGAEGDRLLEDPHFMPQSDQLHEDVVPYSQLYDISELATMRRDLGQHLERQGVDMPARLLRENETPLPVAGRVFPPEVLSTLNRVYRGDLERFGEAWDTDFTRTAGPNWSAEQFRDIGARVTAHRRIADLAGMLKDREEQLAESKRRASNAQRRRRELENELTMWGSRLEKTKAARARTVEKLKEERRRRQLLQRRVAELEAALERRTMRGFPRAVLRRLSRSLRLRRP